MRSHRHTRTRAIWLVKVRFVGYELIASCCLGTAFPRLMGRIDCRLLILLAACSAYHSTIEAKWIRWNSINLLIIIYFVTLSWSLHFDVQWLKYGWWTPFCTCLDCLNLAIQGIFVLSTGITCRGLCTSRVCFPHVFQIILLFLFRVPYNVSVSKLWLVTAASAKDARVSQLRQLVAAAEDIALWGPRGCYNPWVDFSWRSYEKYMKLSS